MRPDVEKLQSYVAALVELPTPDLEDSEAVAVLSEVNNCINDAAELVERFANSKSLKVAAVA